MKIGDLKFGELKGTDGFGNKYYEASDTNSSIWSLLTSSRISSLTISQNLELPYGQHRWVEYKNIHDYDATMIQPE